MHRDFKYHVQAIESGGEDAARINQRITDLETRCAGLDPQPNPKERPPGYEDLVRLAARFCERDESLCLLLERGERGLARPELVLDRGIRDRLQGGVRTGSLPHDHDPRP